MVGSKIAVVDLGTNSFHLLIAKVEEHGFEVLLKEKDFVHLASGGINHIEEKSFQKGLDVIKKYKETMDEHQVSEYKVFGTAGLRKAINSDDFRNEVKNLHGVEVEVIDGDKEAELIYRGVKTAVDLNGHTRLIMDIGGGSTEFILANKDQIFWKKSFPLGARVLKNEFHHQNPIHANEYQNLVSFINEELKELWEQIEIHKPTGLIGASGSFRTLVDIQRGTNQLFPNLEGESEIVNLSGFRVTHLQMIKSTLEERLQMADLEPERAPLMPVATTLMSILITKMNLERSITVSYHAMKEGMLHEMRDKYFAKA